MTVFMHLGHGDFYVKVLYFYLLTSSQMEFCISSALSLICLQNQSHPCSTLSQGCVFVCTLLSIIIKDLIKSTSLCLDFVELVD